MHQLSVLEKNRRQHDPDQISREHGLALGGIGQAAEQKQDNQHEFDLGLAHPCADESKEPGREARQNQQGCDGCRRKAQQPEIVVGEHDPERQNRAEVVHETRRQDDLAELGLVEPGLHHDGVDDGDRGR